MAQEEKVKKTKLKKEVALDGDLLGGDTPVLKSKANSKTKEKSQRGQKGARQQKVKKENADTAEAADDIRLKLDVKEEPDDGDFVTEKKGKKRKRRQESVDGPPSSTTQSLPKKKKKVAQDVEGGSGVEAKKRKSEIKTKKVKKEEKEQTVTSKKKKTKEEIEAARAMKIKKKEEEEQQRWRWWEEERYKDGIKWKFLEHKGPYFPPEYQPLPDDVRFYYDGTFKSPSKCDEIHSRVQRILHSDVTRCKLSFDEQTEEQESDRNKPLASCHDSQYDTQQQPDRVIPGEPSVNLNNKTFWTKKAAQYIGKPYRAVFEDSLGTIYRNLYSKASNS